MGVRRKVFARVAAAGLAAAVLCANSNFQAFATLGDIVEMIPQKKEAGFSTPSEATPSEASESEGEKETIITEVKAVKDIAATPSEALKVSTEVFEGTWSLMKGDGILKDSANQETDTVQIGRGTYTNSEGQSFGIDASAGKFNIQAERTQINKGTTLEIPAAGEVFWFEIIAHKVWDGSRASSDSSGILEGAESVVVIQGAKSCKAESYADIDNNYRSYTYRCVLEKGAEQAVVTVAATGSQYVKSLEVKSFPATDVNISGHLEVENGDSPKNVKVILLNERTKEIFTDIVNFSNGEASYEVKVPVYDEEEDYQIYLDNDRYKISGIDQIRVSGGTDSEDCDFSVTSSEKHLVSISFSEKIDLDGMEYTYTNSETNQVYSFKTSEKIELTEGNYIFSFGGEADRLAYEISDGESIAMKDKDITQRVDLEPVTEWSFYADGSNDYYQKTIQNETGYFKGAVIDATSGKVLPNGDVKSANSSQFVTGAVIRIPVTGDCTMSVEAYGPQYALYSVNGVSANNQSPFVYKYEGEKGYIDITSDGSAYIKTVTLVYPPKEVQYKEQPVMPAVADFGMGDNLTVSPEGQRLVLTQVGGVMTSAGLNTVSYYVFPKTKDWQVLSADVVLKAGTTSTSSGVFFGAFDEEYLTTVGIRGKTGLRGILSKTTSEMVGAGGPNQTIVDGEKVSFTARKTDGGLFVTYKTKSAGESSYTFKYDDGKNLLFKESKADTDCYYGFALASGTAVITNMMLYDEADNILYDQNDCYEPEGTAPVAQKVMSEADDSREFIHVTWTGEICSGDEKYVLQVSNDGVSWEDVADDLTVNTYDCPITGNGSWYFRVC